MKWEMPAFSSLLTQVTVTADNRAILIQSTIKQYYQHFATLPTVVFTLGPLCYIL